MGQGGREFTFPSYFSLYAVSHFFLFLFSFFYSIYLRVLMFGASVFTAACVHDKLLELKNEQTAAEGLQSSTPGTQKTWACWGWLRGTSRYPLFRSRVVSIFD